MNLEEVETRCLNYLRQVQKPVVSLRVLLEHCQRTPGCEDLEYKALLQFLRKHGEIHLVEGPGTDEAVGTEMLAGAGLDMGPRVLLAARMPSTSDLSQIMAGQLAVMTESLEVALAEASRQGDAEKEAQLRAALTRAENLRRKTRQLRGSDTEGTN